MNIGDKALLKVVITKIIEDAKGKMYEVEIAERNEDYIPMFSSMVVREDNLGLLGLRGKEGK